jgi:hypothetical protein
MHHELAGRGLYGRLFPRHHVTGAGAAGTTPSTRPPTDQSITDFRRSSQISVAEQELIRKLEEAGYTQVRDVKSTAEGIVAKAMKDGKEVSLVVDSSGKFRER